MVKNCWPQSLERRARILSEAGHAGDEEGRRTKGTRPFTWELEETKKVRQREQTAECLLCYYGTSSCRWTKRRRWSLQGSLQLFSGHSVGCSDRRLAGLWSELQPGSDVDWNSSKATIEPANLSCRRSRRRPRTSLLTDLLTQEL